MRARFVFLLMLGAIAAGAGAWGWASAQPAGTPEEKAAAAARQRSEDAAKAARQDKDATKRLRANQPPVYRRDEQPDYRDALDKAQRREDRSAHEAVDAMRDADRAARDAVRAQDERLHQQRLDDFNERRRRDLDGDLWRR